MSTSGKSLRLSNRKSGTQRLSSARKTTRHRRNLHSTASFPDETERFPLRTSRRYTVASLFAGMGGFCKAFRDVGFRVVWANENDRFAALTHRHNFPEARLLECSIELLSVVRDKLASVDVVTAGFPCQPFSVAGDKQGFSDRRGKLFFEIVRLLGEFGADRPKILILENVPYLLAHDRGRTFNRIVQEIQAAGYWFLPKKNHAILNTCRHTHIPQKRERLYMAALSWDHFDSNDFEFPRPTEHTRDFREFLDLQHKADDFYYKQDTKWGLLYLQSMAAGDPDAVYQLRRHYVREIKSSVVPTLTAHMGDGAQNVPVIRDEWGVRQLTPVECMRLQGLRDDELVFPPDLSRSQQYKQIGNAVTVALARKLAVECVRQLEKRRRKERQQ